MSGYGGGKGMWRETMKPKSANGLSLGHGRRLVKSNLALFFWAKLVDFNVRPGTLLPSQASVLLWRIAQSTRQSIVTPAGHSSASHKQRK